MVSEATLGCPFCQLGPEDLLLDGDHVRALWDAFPVSPGHALVITRRHVPSLSEASPPERLALITAIETVVNRIREEFDPAGFNYGINEGSAAGQTVPHLHLHIIPRYAGDVADPVGGVRGVIPGKANYLRNGSLPTAIDATAEGTHLTTGADSPLLPLLNAELDRAEAIDIAVAFIQSSGMDRIEDRIRDAVQRGADIRIVVGDYLGITDPLALSRIADIQEEHPDSLRAYIFESDGTSYHPKSYIFRHRDGSGVAFVGSSNLSGSALEDGVEWNYRVVGASEREGFSAVASAFEDLLLDPRVRPLDSDWIGRYRQRRRPPSDRTGHEVSTDALDGVPEKAAAPPEPHAVQEEALAALKETRRVGNRAGLVVLATGLGKTWLSAFDSARQEFERVLFVAHREEILEQARRTFRRIRPKADLGLYTGTAKHRDADVLFASIQTLSRQRHLDGFDPDSFDYIIVDEFHHAAAATYRRLIEYFSPKFLLGLTATPDRTDGADLLGLCGENLVFERGLAAGIEQGLLSPFRYYGVPDLVDYANIPWRSGRFAPDELESAVATIERAQNAYEQWQEHGGLRTLAFCCSTRHANFMRGFFQERGVACDAVHSGPDSGPRTASLERLTAGELAVVFAVDMFNEGVDVPEIDTVLMLRPTESTILWLQQFGRGLRKTEQKAHLNVIDYIGNHRAFLNRPRTLFQLPPGDAHVERVLNMLQQGEAELPPGCEITYELESIEVLRSLLRQPRGIEAVRAFYEEFKLRNGIRPTAREAFHAGYDPKSVRKHYGSWHRFVEAQGDLAEGAALLDGVTGSFLEALETTPMTRSYKMVTLMSMLNQDALPGGLGLNQLASGALRIAERSAAIAEEFSGTGLQLDQISELLIQNPIPAWTEGRGTGNRSYFEYGRGELRSSFTAPVELREIFQELVREIADWRMAQYLTRQAHKHEPGEFLARVFQSSGKPILKLPARDKVDGIPMGETPLRVDGEAHVARFVKIALNVVTEADGSDNVLPRILRGWFGPDAGQPGTRFHVRFRQMEGGVWQMEPVHEKEPDHAKPGPVLWHRYARSEIPGLFGLEFSEATWNQGHVLEDALQVLLPTLESSTLTSVERYANRFLAADEFEWQSQNQTARRYKRGIAIKDHVKLGIDTHLFVRPRKRNPDGSTAGFIYCGKVDFVSWRGDKPITVTWRLRQPVPDSFRSTLAVPDDSDSAN